MEDNVIFDINDYFLAGSSLISQGIDLLENDSNQASKYLLQAIDKFKQIVIVEPDYEEAFFNLGLAYYLLQDYYNAIVYYSKVLEFNPEDTESLCDRANCYIKCEDFKKALDDFNQIILLEQDNPHIFLQRAVVKVQLNNFDEALDDFTKAIELDSTNYIYFYNRGNFYKDVAMYKLAIKDYQESCRLKSDYYLCYLQLANCYIQLFDYDNAYKNLLLALKLNDNDYLIYFNLAYCLDKLGKFQMAIDNYSKCLDLSESFCEGYINRAIIYSKLKKYSEAHFDFVKALEFDNSKNSQIYFNRSIVYSEEKKYTQALSDLNKAIELAPLRYEYYENRANLLFKQRKFDEAYSDCFNACELNVEEFAKKFMAFYDILHIPNIAKERTLLNKAIKLNPDDTNLRLCLIIFLLKERKYIEALSEFKRNNFNEITYDQNRSIYFTSILIDIYNKKLESALEKISNITSDSTYKLFLKSIILIINRDFEQLINIFDSIAKNHNFSFIHIFKLLIQKYKLNTAIDIEKSYMNYYNVSKIINVKQFDRLLLELLKTPDESIILSASDINPERKVLAFFAIQLIQDKEPAKYRQFLAQNLKSESAISFVSNNLT